MNLREALNGIAANNHQKQMMTKDLRWKLECMEADFHRKNAEIIHEFFDSVTDAQVLDILDPFIFPANMTRIETIKWIRQEIDMEWGIHAPLGWTYDFYKRNF